MRPRPERGLTVNLAFELARFNITVNAISARSRPDAVLGAGHQGGQGYRSLFFGSSPHDVPMQRMGKPEDIAGVALFSSLRPIGLYDRRIIDGGWRAASASIYAKININKQRKFKIKNKKSQINSSMNTNV